MFRQFIKEKTPFVFMKLENDYFECPNDKKRLEQIFFDICINNPEYEVVVIDTDYPDNSLTIERIWSNVKYYKLSNGKYIILPCECKSEQYLHLILDVNPSSNALFFSGMKIYFMMDFNEYHEKLSKFKHNLDKFCKLFNCSYETLKQTYEYFVNPNRNMFE
jgi:hypothetical protein